MSLHHPLHTCNTAQYEDILRRLKDARSAARKARKPHITLREAVDSIGERVKSTRNTEGR